MVTRAAALLFSCAGIAALIALALTGCMNDHEMRAAKAEAAKAETAVKVPAASQPETGEPVIDFSRWNYAGTYSNITVRDYFATQALTGFLLNRAPLPGDEQRDDGIVYGAATREVIAREAYEYADAMLAERSKQK